MGQEALFGGSAGGGKTDALLMAALQYVTVPGYSALLLRRTYKQLMKDGGLVPRSKEWLLGKARWNGTEMQWTFPSGATLSFGYYDHDDHYMNYQGGAWQYVGFDELTQFKESWYKYLFSRTRKLAGSRIPIRIRAASNPGGPGHEWCKRRFIARGSNKFFVPSRLEDNPGLDKEEYIKSLAELDPITRAQLLAGDWDAYQGGRFRREWFREFCVDTDSAGQPRYLLQVGTKPTGEPIFDHPGIHVARCHNFVICDPASRAGESNDFTAIGVFCLTPCRRLLVLDVVREHLPLEKIVPRIAEVCRDYAPLWVGIEDVGFQIGLINEARRHEDIPAVRGLSPEGKEKLVRATPAIIRAEAGTIYVPERGPAFPWVEDFIGELVQFTGDDDQDAHDDQVDVLSYAALSLDRGGGGPTLVTAGGDDHESWGGWRR